MFRFRTYSKTPKSHQGVRRRGLIRVLGFCGLILAVPLLQAQSCGPNSTRSEGEACTRARDCEEPLRCMAGMCTEPRDAAVVDGAVLDGTVLDAGADTE